MVVSAHYDHLGVGPAVDGDAIYNGVVDNALGVAGALEIARVVTALGERPRRSVIFVFTAAEEEGNLGALYFLDHPPLPLSRLMANINVDGLAFLDSFRDVIGIGAELSELGGMLESAARELGVEVGHAEGVVAGHEAYMRSDQAAFAAAGVPAILVNEGFRWRSHRPGIGASPDRRVAGRGLPQPGRRPRAAARLRGEAGSTAAWCSRCC